ncbi:Lytic enzyme, partial [Salmonella enterica subsp. enterica serovar Rubislaw str. A4-653]
LKYSGDMVRVTQIINGGQNGIGDRRERFEKAKWVLI